MCNVKLKTLDNFLRVPVHDLALFPQIVLMPEYPQTGITEPSNNLGMSVRTYSTRILCEIMELRTLGYFLCVASHGFRVWAQFTQNSLMPKYL